VDLDVRGGEIHALVGANGSGKSTLVKILAGVYRPDGGVIRVGERVFGGGLSPSEARAVGLHFVHQDLAIFTDLSVADNIAIGRGFDTDPLGRIRWRSVRRHTSRVLDRFHIAARPDTPVGALRPSDRTMVAIARALQDQEGQDSGVLVLDEPTTSLPDADVGLLIAALRRFAEAGQSMLFISHDIDEALSFVDRVSVLRDGRKVATLDAARPDRDQVVELITGRPVGRLYPAPPQGPDGGARLQVRNVSVGPVQDVSFDVPAGEIVGLAGCCWTSRPRAWMSALGPRSTSGSARLPTGARPCSW
jgi:ribose transport system ATP-binding protein